MQRTVIPVAAWVATIAVLTLFSSQIVQPPAWFGWLSAAALALLLPFTSRRVIGRLEGVLRIGRPAVTATVSALALLIASAGGGTGSLVSLVMAFPVILALKWFGLERGIGTAVLLFAAMLAADLFLVGRPVDMQSSIMMLVAIAAFVVAGSSGYRHTGSALPSVESAAAPGTPSPEHTPRAMQSQAPEVTSAASTSIMPAVAERGAAVVETDVLPPLDPQVVSERPHRGTRQWWRSGEENRVVAEYLLDVRASTGADETVVWLLSDGDSVLRPLAACSSTDWLEQSNADDKWMSVVRWSVEGNVVLAGNLENAGAFVVAPLELDGRLMGVLCMRSRSGFSERVELLKVRAAHHAAYVARLATLVDLQRSATTRTEALDHALAAVRGLQERADVDAPAAAICDAILQVCGCEASALVRWDDREARGVVEFSAGLFESMERSTVEPTSLTGTTCARGTPFKLGAAADVLSRLPVVAGTERIGSVGALSIHPMKRDGRVMGALIAAWARPTDLLRYTSSGMEILASAAAHALDSAWRLEEAQIVARTDVLTGLSNRRHLDEQMSRVLAESQRYGDPTSLILLDLDFFKSINDKHGHAVGDMVLRHVAETLLDGVRGVDVCARYGGEELAVLLPRTTLDGAMELAERLRSMVEMRPLSLADAEIKITASFGVATFPDAAATPSALVASADKALYKAKEAGRNRVRSAR